MTTGKLLGHSGDQDTFDGYTASYFCLFKYTAEATGTLSEIRIKCSSAANIKVGFYDDSSGEPGSRLGKKDASTTVIAGWNTIALESSVSVTKDTVYWLAFNVDTDSSIRTDYYYTNPRRFKTATYSTFTFPDPAGAGFSGDNTAGALIQGYGVLVISPSGHQQPIAYGTPTVEISGLVISPPGHQVVIAYGTPSLRYPQTVSPPGLAVPIAYGTPSIVVAGAGVIYVPGHQQAIGYGMPTILKYVWHVILDGRYSTETPGVNRAYIIGEDANGNPVYGEAQDSAEIALVGERLDFSSDPAIPTSSQAVDVATAVLSKMRLLGKSGVILIPPNCGQELWDVVQITDSGANQQAVKFRVVGIRFEYQPRQARYQHMLILGA